jgi:VanZ family protein
VAIPHRKIRSALTGVLALYWVILFVATHLARLPAAVESAASDKWYHFGGYAVLTLLLSARIVLSRSLTWKSAIATLCAIGLYGVVDEISQIPVGRDAEIADWCADIAGAAVGLCAIAVLLAVMARRSARPKA